MADLVAVQSGNFTDATTWGVVDTISKNVSNNVSTSSVTTAGSLETPTFTPGAITISGICIRLGLRNPGTPTNAMTLSLRNMTTTINVVVITTNVSAFPYCNSGIDGEGGWLHFKLAAPITLTAATGYRLRLQTNSTSTVVTCSTNGTTNNWQRMLITTTTKVPAAGDDLYVCGIYNGAANPVTAITPLTVNMNEVAATDYGTASIDNYLSALAISNGGTLSYDPTLNTILRLSGHLKVYRGGTLAMGTVATPISRSSTAILEFDCAVDGGFGLRALGGSNIILQGQSRTAGKDISLTLLTADVAAAGTSLTVANDTGWLSGDRIAIASTSRNATEAEDVALTADAGASSLAVGAIGFAHIGDAATERQAEVLLLTRNVIVRSVSATFMTYVRFRDTSVANPPVSFPIFDCDWVQFRYVGFGGAALGGITLEMSEARASISFDHCIVWGTESVGWFFTGSSPTIDLRNCAVYHCIGTGGGGIYSIIDDSFFLHPWTIDNFTFIGKNFGGATPATQFFGVHMIPTHNISITNLRASSGSGGLVLTLNTPPDDIVFTTVEWGPLNLHSNSGGTGAGGGLIFNGQSVAGMRFRDVHAWRNGHSGIYFPNGKSASDIYFKGITNLTGNNNAGVYFAQGSGAQLGIVIQNIFASGEIDFDQSHAIEVNSCANEIFLQSGQIGSVNPPWVPHDITGIYWNNDRTVYIQATLRNITGDDDFFDYNLLNGASTLNSYIAIQRDDNVIGSNYTRTALGDIDHSTFISMDGSMLNPPGVIMWPLIGPYILEGRLESGAMRPFRGFLVPVLIGQSGQVAVSVYADPSYTGNPPRLILKGNSTLGFLEDVVIATMTVGLDTWETLTGTSPVVTDNGVLEFVVDCDGNDGFVCVNQWNIGSTPAGKEDVWHDGLPFRSGPAATSGGGGTGGTRGYAFIG